jgi:hypothetical protein
MARLASVRQPERTSVSCRIAWQIQSLTRPKIKPNVLSPTLLNQTLSAAYNGVQRGDVQWLKPGRSARTKLLQCPFFDNVPSLVKHFVLAEQPGLSHCTSASVPRYTGNHLLEVMGNALH